MANQNVDFALTVNYFVIFIFYLHRMYNHCKNLKKLGIYYQGIKTSGENIYLYEHESCIFSEMTGTLRKWEFKYTDCASKLYKY